MRDSFKGQANRNVIVLRDRQTEKIPILWEQIVPFLGLPVGSEMKFVDGEIIVSVGEGSYSFVSGEVLSEILAVESSSHTDKG